MATPVEDASENPITSNGEQSSLLQSDSGVQMAASPLDELPDYASLLPQPQASLATHTYRHPNEPKSTATMRVTLTLLRSFAASSNHLPCYFLGQPVEGVIELDFPQPENLTGIEVKLRGALFEPTNQLAGADDSQASSFYTLTKTIWSPSAPTRKTSFLNRLRQRDGERVEGHRQFNFTLVVPKDAKVEGNTDQGLPPSFIEQGARTTIQYTIRAKVRRGALSADINVGGIIALLPPSVPLSFSVLRAAACEEGHGHILGPHDDPDGWETLPTVKITGELFGVRKVDVEYTLSVAKPLTYTRGTHIPLCITLATDDDQALALLSATSALSVRLSAHLDAGARRTPSQSSRKQPSIETRPLESAVWWPVAPKQSDGANIESQHLANSKRSKTLMGEIHLSSDLCPSFEALGVQLFYSVNLIQPIVTGFKPISSYPERNGIPFGTKQTQALVSQRVVLVTHVRPGQRPRAVTPPSYGQVEPWPQASATADSGFL